MAAIQISQILMKEHFIGIKLHYLAHSIKQALVCI